MNEKQRTLLKDLPRMDELLERLQARGTMDSVDRGMVKELARRVIEGLRQRILAASEEEMDRLRPLLEPERMVLDTEDLLAELQGFSLRPVVNATGIIIHTNLGRAPLCPEALARVAAVGRGYSNLEYDLEKGERGERGRHVQNILNLLTGAEDALVVNNNAAAVFLVLNTLAAGREVIISRGELIEIGGEFRIPEIMAKSGARLKEVGTTNRTRLADYERAITCETALIMKVHTSNYRIVGFTEEVELVDLVSLGKKWQIPVANDLGSGCLLDLARYGLQKEPLAAEVIAGGADLVTFSGDKLLGGPQAGIIIGKKELIGQLKKNPLNRALRIDKLTLAALEGTLVNYLNPRTAAARIRVLHSLTEPLEEVRKRARKLKTILQKVVPKSLTLNIREGTAFAGGGSLPLQEIPTVLIALEDRDRGAHTLDARLRKEGIIGRIAGEELLFDVRTIVEEEFVPIQEALRKVTQQHSP